MILELDGVARAEYDAVNAAVNFDNTDPDGDWPQGIRFHAGAAKPGGAVVFEVRESRGAQERFMSERLGPGLRQAGITSAPTRSEWLDLAAHTTISN